MERNRNVQVEDQLEQAAFRHLVDDLFPRVHQIADRLEADLCVPPGSVLAGDDAIANYSPISNQVTQLANSALDHLETVERVIRGSDGGVPPFALYTLVRSAVEAASHIIWLASGGTRDKRVLRSLKLIHAEGADVGRLTASLGGGNGAGATRRHERLTEILNSRPGLRGKSFEKMEATNEVIAEADSKITAPDLMSALDTWRVCSSVAHSNSQAMIALMEREHVRNLGPGNDEYRITAAISVVATVYSVAVNTLEQSILVVGALQRPQY